MGKLLALMSFVRSEDRGAAAVHSAAHADRRCHESKTYENALWLPLSLGQTIAVLLQNGSLIIRIPSLDRLMPVATADECRIDDVVYSQTP